ncbi:MAG: PspC domain-containing protein, partial [Serratia liquefaciens]|nr:PspC domain-containing protein [Serratia liquefaciens]
MNNTLGSKKLYRVPEEGMLKGVCAGLAHYFDVPVRLIRVMVVLSMFFGLFF